MYCILYVNNINAMLIVGKYNEYNYRMSAKYIYSVSQKSNPP